jgi:hypothetical protein
LKHWTLTLIASLALGTATAKDWEHTFPGERSRYQTLAWSDARVFVAAGKVGHVFELRSGDLVASFSDLPEPILRADLHGDRLLIWRDGSASDLHDLASGAKVELVYNIVLRSGEALYGLTHEPPRLVQLAADGSESWGQDLRADLVVHSLLEIDDGVVVRGRHGFARFDTEGVLQADHVISEDEVKRLHGEGGLNVEIVRTPKKDLVVLTMDVAGAEGRLFIHDGKALKDVELPELAGAGIHWADLGHDRRLDFLRKKKPFAVFKVDMTDAEAKAARDERAHAVVVVDLTKRKVVRRLVVGNISDLAGAGYVRTPDGTLRDLATGKAAAQTQGISPKFGDSTWSAEHDGAIHFGPLTRSGGRALPLPHPNAFPTRVQGDVLTLRGGGTRRNGTAGDEPAVVVLLDCAKGKLIPVLEAPKAWWVNDVDLDPVGHEDYALVMVEIKKDDGSEETRVYCKRR